MLKVEVITEAAGLAALEPAWDALAQETAASLFDTPAFLRTWWTYFGDAQKLRVTAVWADGRLVALAPLVVRSEIYGGLPTRMLAFMHNKHISRSAILVQPGREDEVLAAMTDSWVQMRGEWDVLRLPNVPQETRTLARLAPHLQRRRLNVYPVEQARDLFYLSLTGTWDQYVKASSRKHRENLRLCRNRGTKAAAVTLRHTRQDEVDASMQMLFDLQQRSWKSDEDGAFQDVTDQAFYTALARTLAPAGGFENWFMQVSGEIIGGLYILKYGGVAYLMLVFYDRAQNYLWPGRFVIGEAITAAFAERTSQRIDFNGDSQFVRVWTDHCQRLELLSACHTGMYSRMIAGLKSVKRAATWLTGVGR